jgi:hypothetical protein
VQTEERLLDAQILKEKPAVSGVLSRDQVGRLQNLDGP